MYRVGQKEVDAVARVLLSGELFRYHIGGECERFEKRYAKYVGAKHCRMTSSGTTALTAVLGGLGLGPGDEINIAGGKKKIVGVFNTGNTFGDSAVMMPLVPFQGYERQPGGLSLFFVKVHKGTPVKTVEARIEEQNPILIGIKNLLEFGRADRSYQLISGADRAATIVAIVVGAIVVANAMLLSLVERYREFGVLRAIGWSRRRLVALIFGEAAIIAFVGACLGVGLAFVGVWLLADLPDLAGILKPTFEGWIFGRALVTATAVTAIGALYPALRAARLSPQEAMRRE